MKTANNVDIRRGMIAEVRTVSGRTVVGMIDAVWKQSMLGWRIDIGADTYGIDDVLRTWPVRLLRTRIEVGSLSRGKRGYRWTVGYYVVGPNSLKQYPPLSRNAAYYSARAQWPHCVIAVKDDE